MADQPAIDCRDVSGTPVRCSRERWVGKIEANHPELRDRPGDIAGVIEAPDWVLQDRQYGNRRHHIRLQANGLFLVAVVEYRYVEQGVAGHLVTAFLRTKLREGDKVLYSHIPEDTA
ncbi:MAG: hypothetical protein IT303_09800 [Dehalococcoidia bacterium]|nr:hypothetical protein [Dehalococcoidia bacterium]